MAAEAENARKDAYLQAENEYEAKLAKGKFLFTFKNSCASMPRKELF